jgi:hypothetical protein
MRCMTRPGMRCGSGLELMSRGEASSGGGGQESSLAPQGGRAAERRGMHLIWAKTSTRLRSRLDWSKGVLPASRCRLPAEVTCNHHAAHHTIRTPAGHAPDGSQVVAVNGDRFAGAIRDTLLVPARGGVTIAFDAVNSARWALHCHHLYHMGGGVMTSVEYEA